MEPSKAFDELPKEVQVKGVKHNVSIERLKTAETQSRLWSRE